MKKLRLTALAAAVALLASCSVFTQEQTEPVPAAKKSTKKPRKKTTTATQAIEKTTSAPLLEGDVSTEASFTEAPSYATTSPIPGRSGLRMGRFAPPEEATSTGSNEPPVPNAAEQRGLRSPQLPGTLPLDVNGQTKKN